MSKCCVAMNGMSQYEVVGFLFRSTSFAVKRDQGKQETMSVSFAPTKKNETGAITFARHIHSEGALVAVVGGQEASIEQEMGVCEVRGCVRQPSSERRTHASCVQHGRTKRTWTAVK